MRVRGALFIAAVWLGLALMAGTASAHGPSEATTVSGAAVAFSSGTGAVTNDSVAHAMDDRAAHAGKPSHDPDDHSHPLGEDNYHQKASHVSLDFAFDQKSLPLAGVDAASSKIIISNQYARGITVSPPVPPPLG